MRYEREKISGFYGPINQRLDTIRGYNAERHIAEVIAGSELIYGIRRSPNNSFDDQIRRDLIVQLIAGRKTRHIPNHRVFIQAKAGTNSVIELEMKTTNNPNVRTGETNSYFFSNRLIVMGANNGDEEMMKYFEARVGMMNDYFRDLKKHSHDFKSINTEATNRRRLNNNW